jgi:protein-L-isoaspartate O-methyltransferase/radical SAM superfamily enzyme YgiQ (UPF0313 family)
MNKVSLLLVWPGTHGAAAGNFGVPQLVGLATYVRGKTGASVAVRDLGAERALGTDIWKMLAGDENGQPWSIIGLSCYSSYDYLLCQAIALRIAEISPETIVVAGGYHPSARPGDFTPDDGFDVCVIGEGEKPLVTIVEAVAGGVRESLRGLTLGPDAIAHYDEIPLSDWSLLNRYKSVARRIASQAEIYLSRGCPFDCAFCMERAKRETSWRAFDVERALEEFKNLNQFLNLERWTVYVADALFGMRKQWRRAFLEGLARSGIKTVRTWLLVRVDMIDDEDLQLFQAANCAPGFGLESGDPVQLARIRKSGRLDDYLAKMEHVSARARELDLPWGANVIVGHPGETEASMGTSAAYLKRLFHDPRGVTGFLSVDPFRLYPGSPIDDDRATWQAQTGCRFYRPEWWKDGDQEFLSEWVDPSYDLGYDRRVALTNELFAPLMQDAPKYFAYRGTGGGSAEESRAYFQRALDGQIEQFAPRTRMHYRKLRYSWAKYTGRSAEARRTLRDDADFARDAAERRAATIAGLAVGPVRSQPAILDALRTVPRERFVPLDALGDAHKDQAIPLDASGDSSVSAFHAYLRTFTLAGISKGMRVLDLGAGTGYGTALLATLVGETGSVLGVELDPSHAAIGAETLAAWPQATLLAGDAFVSARRDAGSENAFASEFAADPRWDAIVVGFTIAEIPATWHRVGRVIVAPVALDGSTTHARLTRVVCTEKGFETEAFDEVRYVRTRSLGDLPAGHVATIYAATSDTSARTRRSLPVVTR